MLVDEYPLSSLQQGMLFHALSVPHSGVDIEQVTIDYHERLEVDLLERAWQLETDRHPLLRSSFHWVDVPEPVQRVQASVCLRVDRRPLADEAAFQAFLVADRHRGFDLGSPPLTRLTLFELGPDCFRLVWTVHHILMDGRAFGIVLTQVQEQYHRLKNNEAPVTTPGPAYRPYVEWQRSQDLSGAIAFWRARFVGLDGPSPIPPDFAKEGTDSTELVETELSEASTAALVRVAEEYGFTLNTILMGVWGVLLARYADAERVLFGTVKTSRSSSVAGASEVVGLFLNTLPVRLDLGGDLSVVEALRQLRAEWLSLRQVPVHAAYAHQAGRVGGRSELPVRHHRHLRERALQPRAFEVVAQLVREERHPSRANRVPADFQGVWASGPAAAAGIRPREVFCGNCQAVAGTCAAAPYRHLGGSPRQGAQHRAHDPAGARPRSA